MCARKGKRGRNNKEGDRVHLEKEREKKREKKVN